MNKLQKLHAMRERCGIVFSKSFRCKDAEKNMHLLDAETFFEKFKKKLKLMGYKPSEDFEFNIIRYRYDYAERHHVGKTYNWKYFYSSTFTISDDLIQYLLLHRFIFVKNESVAKFKKLVSPKKASADEKQEYISSLLDGGNTRAEIVSDLRQKYEQFKSELDSKKDLLENNNNFGEAINLKEEVKYLKAQARWCKQCIYEIRVGSNESDIELLQQYKKILVPLKQGKNLEETREYLKNKINELSEKLIEVESKLKDKTGKYDNSRILGFHHEKKEKQKNMQEFTTCLQELDKGRFDHIFND